VHGKVILHIPAISHIKASLYHVVELKLEDIHVICEFSDVSSDDRPVIPPIAKAPYKMSPVELK
jgi:hypothetical protein